MRDRAFCFSLVLPLTLIALMLSCGKASRTWSGTITEESGIAIVKNPKEPMYPAEALTLAEDLSIGVQEGSEDYLLQVFSADGVLIKKIFKEYDPVKVTDAEKKERTKDTPMVCKDSALYTLEEDEDGYQSVKRYRMVWGI